MGRVYRTAHGRPARSAVGGMARASASFPKAALTSLRCQFAIFANLPKLPNTFFRTLRWLRVKRGVPRPGAAQEVYRAQARLRCRPERARAVSPRSARH